MKICQHLRLHTKLICWRFHIKSFTFSDMRTWETWNDCLKTNSNNSICQKLAYFLRNLQTSQADNSKILRIKNVKSSGYCFYLYTYIWGDFQICISVPLSPNMGKGGTEKSLYLDTFHSVIHSIKKWYKEYKNTCEQI